jgi:dolichyl-phosphate beta-glucosyltransferase
LLFPVAVIAGFLALSLLLLWWRVWVTGSPSSTITCQCGDPAQELGWLGWFPWAVGHLHNPFYSHALYAGQGGTNVLANPSLLFPAAMLSPITVAFGPVAAFNAAAVLAPALSASCMVLFLRRICRFVPAQLLGGLVWGFSPFVIDNLPLGHLNLVLGFFPPLMALVAQELLQRDRPGPVVLGLAGAGLVVAEFFTSSEMLLVYATLGIFATVLIFVCFRRQVTASWRRLAVCVATAGVTSLLILSYPVVYALAGPRHVSGQLWPDSAANAGSPVDGVLVAGHAAHQVVPLVSLIGYDGPVGPGVTFLGWTLVVFLAVSVVVWRRRSIAWLAAAVGLVSWSLSLGTAGHSAWEPWRLVGHLPVLQQIQPQRFSDSTAFAVGLLFALSIDGWHRLLITRVAHRRPDPRPAATLGWLSLVVPVVVTCIGVAVLVPVALSYSLPYVVQASAPPGWVTAGGARLPPGTRVLTIPYASSVVPDAMAWQADDGFRFDLVGGYAVVPGRDAVHDAWVSPPDGATTVLDALSYGIPPTGTPEQYQAIARALAEWKVARIVVTDEVDDPSYSVAFVTAVTETAPRQQDGAWVWSLPSRHGGPAAPGDVPPSTLQHCAAGTTAPLAAAQCVLTSLHLS